MSRRRLSGFFGVIGCLYIFSNTRLLTEQVEAALVGLPPQEGLSLLGRDGDAVLPLAELVDSALDTGREPWLVLCVAILDLRLVLLVRVRFDERLCDGGPWLEAFWLVRDHLSGRLLLDLGRFVLSQLSGYPLVDVAGSEVVLQLQLLEAAPW